MVLSKLATSWKKVAVGTIQWQRKDICHQSTVRRFHLILREKDARFGKEMHAIYLLILESLTVFCHPTWYAVYQDQWYFSNAARIWLSLAESWFLLHRIRFWGIHAQGTLDWWVCEGRKRSPRSGYHKTSVCPAFRLARVDRYAVDHTWNSTQAPSDLWTCYCLAKKIDLSVALIRNFLLVIVVYCY